MNISILMSDMKDHLHKEACEHSKPEYPKCINVIPDMYFTLWWTLHHDISLQLRNDWKQR